MVLTEDAESSDCTYDKSLNETLSSEEGTPSPSSGFNFINFMGEDNDVIPLAKKAAALYADKMKVNERSLSSSELDEVSKKLESRFNNAKRYMLSVI
jgi:hypothetical protein